MRVRLQRNQTYDALLLNSLTVQYIQAWQITLPAVRNSVKAKAKGHLAQGLTFSRQEEY